MEAVAVPRAPAHTVVGPSEDGQLHLYFQKRKRSHTITTKPNNNHDEIQQGVSEVMDFASLTPEECTRLAEEARFLVNVSPISRAQRLAERWYMVYEYKRIGILAGTEAVFGESRDPRAVGDDVEVDFRGGVDAFELREGAWVAVERVATFRFRAASPLETLPVVYMGEDAERLRVHIASGGRGDSPPPTTAATAYDYRE
jgi:hypothetical protein